MLNRYNAQCVILYDKYTEFHVTSVLLTETLLQFRQLSLNIQYLYVYFSLEVYSIIIVFNIEREVIYVIQTARYCFDIIIHRYKFISYIRAYKL